MSVILSGTFLRHVGNPRESLLAREEVYRLEEPLQAFEPFLALDAEQVIPYRCKSMGSLDVANMNRNETCHATR